MDDASDRAFLRDPLESHLKTLPVPSRVLRSTKRVGLIQARLLGAAKTEGKAIVFLDAHCEVTTGWLEPLLARLAESRTAIVSPVIDIINDDTFAYTKSFSLHWGAFNWEMHFRCVVCEQVSLCFLGSNSIIQILLRMHYYGNMT